MNSTLRAQCSHLETFARKSFTYLVHNYDPKMRVPYFWTFLRPSPPEFRHDAWDVGDGMGRRLDALVTCRIMTGDRAGLAREAEFREYLYGCFRQPHGLIWRPETPWCQPVAEMMDQASSIFGVVSDYLETGSSRSEAIIEGLIRGLLAIAQRDGKGLYFPGSTYFPKGGWKAEGNLAAGPHDHRQDDTWLEGDPAYYGRLLIPFTKFAQVNGSKAALELCRGMAYNIVYQSKRYKPDGSFSRSDWGEQSVWTNGHFHSRFATAAGLVRFGRLVGDEAYIAFARKIFDWGMKQGTAFGWLPEFAGRLTKIEGCETCTVTDAMDLATQFGQLGDASAFELAERIASNQLIESQVWDVDFCDASKVQPDTEMASFDKVAQRSLGGFAGWSAPNDLISGYDDPGWDKDGKHPELRRTLMDCCGGYGNRGLYLAWHNIAPRSGDTVSVNMLLSRRTKDLTIDSLLPYRDEVRLTIHRPCQVRVRIPSWTSAEKIQASLVAGGVVQRKAEGSYLNLGALPAGAMVRLVLGQTARKEHIRLGHAGLNDIQEFGVQWVGDRVVGVEPDGEFSSLYNHRRADTSAAVAQAEILACHLPENEIDW